MPQPPHDAPQDVWDPPYWYLLIEELAAAIFVAAAITLVKHNTIVLDAWNTYAFTALSNSHAWSQHVPPGQGELRAMVLTIDDARYSSEYGEAFPLSRCPLLRDIDLIYKANPSVLVLDFSIAPARWLEKAGVWPDTLPTVKCTEQEFTPKCQAQCQEELYKRIEGSGIPTVAMAPSSYDNWDTLNSLSQQRWVARMTAAGVRIAYADLISRFGILVDAETRGYSIAGETCKALPTSPKPCYEDHKSDEPNIDLRNFLNGTVEKYKMKDFVDEAALRQRAARKVVFFGGTWGRADRYLTPLGKQPGVLIHAVAYTSIGGHYRTREPVALACDIALGALFGPWTVWFWQAYFVQRFSDDPGRQQRSILYALGLVLFFICLMVPASVRLSYELMYYLSIWVSPVPVAVGMFIHSFGASSVVQATREALDRMDPPTPHPHPHPHPPGHPHPHLQAHGYLHQHTYLHQHAHQHAQPQPHAHPHAHPSPLRWITHTRSDFVKLWREAGASGRKRKYHGAALLFLLKRVVWVYVVGRALYIVFT